MQSQTYNGNNGEWQPVGNYLYYLPRPASPQVDGTKSQGKPTGCPSCVSGDPINAATGNAYEIKTEFRGVGPFPLEVTWTYNSSEATESILPIERVLGANRSLSYMRSVRASATSANAAGPIFAYLTRGNGATYVANFVAGVWTVDGDINGALSSTQDGSGNFTSFTYLNDQGQTESYDSAGDLLSITDRNGFQQTLSRETNKALITSVQDSFGRTLQFSYDTSGRLAQVTQPDGGLITFAYDANNNLQKVTYPDTSFVTYNYNESSYTSGANFPDALTSTVDEASIVYDTTTYNAQGLAIANALANNVSSYAFSYQMATDQVTSAPIVASATITEPLNASLSATFQPSLGVNRPSQKSQACTGCVAQSDSFTFDGNGLVQTATDARGYVTAYSHTAALLTQVVEAQGQPTQRTTNTMWNTALRVPLSRTVLDVNGNTVASSAWVYNTSGQTLARCESDPTNAAASSYTCAATGTVPAGVRRWTSTYCTAVSSGCPLIGLLLTSTGPRTDLSQTTTYSYYTTSSATNCGTPGGACYQPGDLYQITDALGHVTTYASYDGAGRVTRITDPNGFNTDMTYTPRGWLASRSVGGSATTFAYMPYGNVKTLTDPDGVVTTFGYDAAHRLTDITDAQGNDIHYTLDVAGNKTAEQISTASGTVVHSLSRSYNALGQLTAVIDGLNQTVFNAGYSDSYDANGNLTHSADGLSIQRQQSYDALNRLVSTLDNYNGTDTATANTTTTTNQDALDRITSVTDPTNLVTSYTHDGLSNLTALQSPDSGASSSTFDAAGNVLTHTDAKGVVATSTYDALDRKTGTSYMDTTANVTYTYDEANSVTGCTASAPIGRLTRMVENAVSTTYCYDARGNVIQKTQVVSGTTDSTSYSYTAADRLSGETTPDGTVISYAFNSNGRISGVQVTPSGSTSASPTVVSSVTWLPFGPISGYTLGNGQTVTRAYDANYRLTDLTSPALTLHFGRDAMGDITALGNAPGANPATESYQYDPLYHLTSVTNSSGVLESYTYNSTGDRLSKTASGLATGTYSYTSGTHQLASIGSAPRANDANGNTTGSVIGGQTYGFAYDSRQRIALAQANGATVGTYLYNALGQRVYTSATSLRFDYDQAGHMLANYGASSRDYVWLDDLPVATVDTTGSGSVTSSTVNYVTADQLGTPRAVTNSAGTAIWSWAYAGNPFGEQQPSSAGYTLNLRYPGQWYDAETGTADNGYRTFESYLGRYAQTDPAGFNGGISTFAYVGSNPLDGIDPLGLQFVIPVPVPDNRPVISPVTGLPQQTQQYPQDDPVALCLAAGPICVGPAAIAIGTAMANQRVDDPAANQEWQTYKDQYNEPPPPDLDECAMLRWALAREQALLAGRQAWDAKWWPGRHDQANQQSMNAIRNLEDKLKKAKCSCP
ncbi:RHS repeat-associated core domain-containing protein [Rhodanobacter sp. MP1X3]|uniref:RHS repeat-associated core domain-containing protein n=1 Tax=Rhodanobacter sp. MP1X3 TaxID=2723086 RepID=UPI00160F151A|nr:RHS repeat-associated protein [Rhodanobacter sp. MP1X3]